MYIKNPFLKCVQGESFEKRKRETYKPLFSFLLFVLVIHSSPDHRFLLFVCPSVFLLFGLAVLEEEASKREHNHPSEHQRDVRADGRNAEMRAVHDSVNRLFHSRLGEVIDAYECGESASEGRSCDDEDALVFESEGSEDNSEQAEDNPSNDDFVCAEMPSNDGEQEKCDHNSNYCTDYE